MTEFSEGKPAKSAATISKALHALRPPKESNQNNERGPLIDGFQADYPITAASFHDPEMAKKFQSYLSQCNIFSKLVIRDGGAAIVVDAEDSRKAAEIFKTTRQQFPNIKPKRLSQRYDFLIFGILIGVTLSLTLVANVWHHPSAKIVWITFCAIGALVGHLCDRFRNQFAIHGKFGLGVAEFLIISTVPVLLILLWDLIPKIIFAQ